MSEEEQDVLAALQRRFGDNEKEIARMLGWYVGHHLTVRGFFRKWLEARLGNQAGWMLDYINVELIADAAVAKGRVITLPAKRRDTFRAGAYVFLYDA